MKLTKENQLGIRFQDDNKMCGQVIAHHTNTFLNKIIDPIEKEECTKRFVDFVLPDRNKNYLFSKKAIEICKRIKVDNKLQPDFFHGLKVGKKVTFILGNNLFYRYEVLDGIIMSMMGMITDLDKDGLYLG